MNAIQKIQLDRVRAASFNNLDGELVANDLEASQELWKGFVFGRFKYYELIELRDISEAILNADTLMILTTIEKWPELQKLINSWNADEVGWIGMVDREICYLHTYPCTKEELFQNYGGGLEEGEIIVRVWWD